jgi:pyruvate dehydrogenase E1 component alpha subunit
MAELFGRATGFNGGRGGSMHIADFSVGMLGANGVVAAGMPIAVGAAHALKLRGAPHIVACFFGDGAINRGPFLEALNWARVYTLPVLFICEDNRWSAMTPSTPLIAGDGAAARARALGIHASTVDGNDVRAVFAQAGMLIDAVRSGGGPRLLHALTYRLKGHVSVDAARYRNAAEVDAALRDDPLQRARASWHEAGGALAELDAIDAAARNEVEAAVAAAAAAPWPEAAAAYDEVQYTGAGVWR